MNEPQEFWWEQTRSDLVILLLIESAVAEFPKYA